MTTPRTARILFIALLALAPVIGCQRAEEPAPPVEQVAYSDALSSWSDGDARQMLVAFVERVTTHGPDYVPPEERIAVFDNDGTLWAEQPIYFELQFAIDRVGALSKDKPELLQRPALAAAASKDPQALAALTTKDAAEIVAATHTDMTAEALSATVQNWLTTAVHPRFGKPYGLLVYEPQLQLIDYLKSKGFQVWIVSGGGVDFMRAFAEKTYGVPPDQVIGTSAAGRFEVVDGRSRVIKTAADPNIDDGAGKPVNIAARIGRRPILAVGNSDGDLQMLQYVTDRQGPSLGVLIHHDDPQREYAYDRQSHVGKLDQALDLAGDRGWLVVSMRDDWRTVFPNAER